MKTHTQVHTIIINKNNISLYIYVTGDILFKCITSLNPNGDHAIPSILSFRQGNLCLNNLPKVS